jgi:hypothetical protein
MAIMLCVADLDEYYCEDDIKSGLVPLMMLNDKPIISGIEIGLDQL